MKLRSLRQLLLVVLMAAGLLLSPTLSSAAGAATNVQVRGVVSCPQGQQVVGIYIKSSGGGSGFATFDREWRRFPGNPHMANFIRYTPMNRPSSVEVRA